MTEPREPRPALTSLAVADPPDRWRALGFTVAPDGRVRIGGVTVLLGGPGRGITGWHVADAPGLSHALRVSEIAPTGAPAATAAHANGATGIDHVVVLTPDFDATAAALQAVGLPFRRVRQASETVRQGFRRLGPVVLEVVEAPQADAGRLWGLVAIVPDLDAVITLAGPLVKPPRPAVQPGRSLAPASADAGLTTQLAFMDPEPDRPADRT